MQNEINNRKISKNKRLFSTPPQKLSFVELIVIFLVVLTFGYLIFSFVSQVYSLNLELKNLVTLVQALQENQINLKNQLSIKDQEIKLLENTIHSMNTSTQTTFDDNLNFELLKKEMLKNNRETSQFFLKTSGAILGAFFIFKLIKTFI